MYPTSVTDQDRLIHQWIDLLESNLTEESKNSLASYITRKVEKFVNKTLLELRSQQNLTGNYPLGFMYVQGLEANLINYPIFKLIFSLFEKFSVQVELKSTFLKPANQKSSSSKKSVTIRIPFLPTEFCDQCLADRPTPAYIEFHLEPPTNSVVFRKTFSLAPLIEEHKRLSKVTLICPLPAFQENSVMLNSFTEVEKNLSSCNVKLKCGPAIARAHQYVLESSDAQEVFANLLRNNTEIEIKTKIPLDRQDLHDILKCLYLSNREQLRAKPLDKLLEIKKIFEWWGLVKLMNVCDFYLKSHLDAKEQTNSFDDLILLLNECQENKWENLREIGEENLVTRMNNALEAKKFSADNFTKILELASTTNNTFILHACCMAALQNPSLTNAFKKGINLKNWSALKNTSLTFNLRKIQKYLQDYYLYHYDELKHEKPVYEKGPIRIEKKKANIEIPLDSLKEYLERVSRTDTVPLLGEFSTMKKDPSKGKSPDIKADTTQEKPSDGNTDTLEEDFVNVKDTN